MERRENNNGCISVFILPCTGKRKTDHPKTFKRHPLPAFIAAATAWMIGSGAMAMTESDSGNSPPRAVKFNTAFIQGTDQPADLNTFLEGNSVVPGTYRVDVYVNRTLSGRRDISFVANPANDTVEACLTLDMLRQFGVNVSELEASDATSSGCFDLSAKVEHQRPSGDDVAQRSRLRVARTVGRGRDSRFRQLQLQRFAPYSRA
jgi:outer membrane usher protein